MPIEFSRLLALKDREPPDRDLDIEGGDCRESGEIIGSSRFRIVASPLYYDGPWEKRIRYKSHGRAHEKSSIDLTNSPRLMKVDISEALQ